MIEFTLTEIVLFCWAILATGFALKYSHELLMTKFFIRKLITDEAVRTQLVAAYQTFEKEHGA
jgi:hypothetical protein